MENPLLSRYHDILQQKEAQFEADIENGNISPFIFPHDFIPLFILFFTLMIKQPRHGILRYTRYLAFAGLSCIALVNLKRCRILGFGNGFGAGLFAAYLIISAAAFLVSTDPQRDFRRIERYVKQRPASKSKDNGRIQNGSLTASGRSEYQPSKLRPRYLTDAANCIPFDPSRENGTLFPQTQRMRIVRWQAYPESISHRFWWVLDLITTFRGPGWSWRISTLPALPEYIPRQTDNIYTEPAEDNESRTGQAVSHLRSAFIQFVISYLALDVIKLLMMRDPYFWGELSSIPPHPYGQIITTSPFLVRIYRILLSTVGFSAALFYVPTFITVMFLGISVLLPQTQAWISTPLDAAWMYPFEFGRLHQELLDNGLEGGWVRGWHQYFRFGFGELCGLILARLPASLQGRRTKRVIQLFIAFGISGALHACGSYTMAGHTNPFSQFVFFASQAPAILLQKFLTGFVVPLILPFEFPRWLRRTGNACFLVSWVLLIAHLLVDDLANGGIWLMEPVPISLVRALGFWGPGVSWWCWHGKWFKWWAGEQWWNSGIQIM